MAQSRLFAIEQLELTFSNGAERTYERLRGMLNGAVMVIPIRADGRMLLIKEYAVGTDRYELGFPKGLIDDGECPLEAANRELQEEIGYASRDIRMLHRLSLAPGYLGARMDIVLAQDLYPSQLSGDEPEPLEVIDFALDDMESLLQRSDFTEARSVAALFLYREWLQNNNRGNNHES